VFALYINNDKIQKKMLQQGGSTMKQHIL